MFLTEKPFQQFNLFITGDRSSTLFLKFYYNVSVAFSFSCICNLVIFCNR